jgi:hypothetical protein
VGASIGSGARRTISVSRAASGGLVTAPARVHFVVSVEASSTITDGKRGLFTIERGRVMPLWNTSR